MTTVAINGAAQLLRPPEDGQPFLRHDRAGEQRLDPGSLLIEGDAIAGWEASAAADVRIDAAGCAVIPGFVDCHTHLPFAGWREGEYERKLAGESYESISRSGGGIRSSGRSLAQSSDEQVLEQAQTLAAEMLAHGTTAFECKSGYGLSPEGEVRSVALAAALAGRVAQPTRSTGLLAHAVPEGYDRSSWMDEVQRMLPDVLAAGEVSALDIYVESVAFSNDDLRRMGRLASDNSLDLRAHVEQFSANHSVPVAVELGARSVDHLSCLPADEVPGLAESETAAVLLPGAEFLGRRADPARPRAGRRRRDLRAGHGPESRHLAGAVDPRGDRARRAPLPVVGARGSAGVDVERSLGAADVRSDRVVGARQARGRARARRADRTDRLPLRAKPGRGGDRGRFTRVRAR